MGQEQSRLADLKPAARLVEAARYGDVETVQQILLRFPDTDINHQNHAGWTPLMEAALLGRTIVVYQLLEHPMIDTNRRSVDGLTALMMASWWGFAAVVQLLMRHPTTDVNAVNEEGLTALMKVTSSGSTNNLVPEQERMRAKGHIVVIRLLLTHPQLDVNVQDKHGNTALIYAAKMGKVELCEELLKHPVVDVTIRNCQKKTALDLTKNKTIIEMLKEAARQREERVAAITQLCRPVSASVVANEMGRLEDDNTCVICLSAPRQCGFLHAGTTHDIVCRACAKAIPVGAPCPLCRQKVEALLPMEGVAEPAPMHAPPPAAPIFV